ncbi:hypothetical protein N9E20_02620 [Crocinitomicaceae bacterium]|nr:hypothetical protein [Crocinitomicaceae bacterium]
MRYIFLLLVITISFFSCKKEKTTWNSQWQLPLVNDTLTLDNLVLDSILVVDAEGNYSVRTDQTLLNVNLADLITIPDTTLFLTYNLPFAQANLPPGTTIEGGLENHDFLIPDVDITKMRVSEGQLNITIENNLSDMVIYTVSMPGVLHNGIPFSENYEVPSGTITNPGIKNAFIDVAGFDMDLTGVSGGGSNLVQTKIDVTTDINGGIVTMTQEDTVKIYIELKDVKIDYARGYFGNQIISDTTEMNIDFLNNITSGGLDLDKASITLSLENGMKLPAKSTIYFVESENVSNETIRLSSTGQNGFTFGIPFNIDPATGSWNTLVSSYHSILFNEQNSNLVNYIEHLGAKQKIGYQISINPWGNTSGGWNEMFPQSELKVNASIDIPLKVGFNQLTLKDTFDFSITQNIDKTHAQKGQLILEANNAFPYSGHIELRFLDQNKNEIYQTNATEEIKSSLFGTSATADNILYTTSQLTVELGEVLFNQLNEVKFVEVTTLFNSPDPSDGTNKKYAIPEGAFLGIKLNGDIHLVNSY